MTGLDWDWDRARQQERISQVEQDLAELEVAVAGGEIDPDTAAWLWSRYQKELRQARAGLASVDAAVSECNSPTGPKPKQDDSDQSSDGSVSTTTDIKQVAPASSGLADTHLVAETGQSPGQLSDQQLSSTSTGPVSETKPTHTSTEPALVADVPLQERRIQDGKRAGQKTRSSLSRRAGWYTGLGLVLVTVGVIGSLIWLPDSTSQDQLAPEQVDLDSISNETMEAVIAANADHPDIAGMRFALGNRYFAEGQYSAAFEHYQEVLNSETNTAMEAATMIRVGWIVWDGNQQPDLAVSLLQQALELAPGDSLGWYLLGQVEWCGKSDFVSAEQRLEQALSNPELDPDSVSAIRRDLAAIQAGEECG